MGMRSRNAGVTLVELMVAVATGAVMLVPLALLLTNADFAVRLGQVQAENQREATYALSRLGHMIRAASVLRVENGGAKLTIERRVGSVVEWRRSIIAERGALKITEEGRPDEVVISRGVISLSFRYPQDGVGPAIRTAVEVALTVGAGDGQVSVQTTLAARNIEG